MENASKALLIAGAVLLAMIVVSAIVMVQRNMGDALKQQDKSLEAKQLAEFNMKYQSYQKELRGIDLRSLMNMADNDNTKDSRQIVIEFTVKKRLDVATPTGEDCTILYSNIGDGRKNFEKEVSENADSTYLTNFNKRVFKCDRFELDETGRVKRMTFLEITTVITTN